jgi:23S rRNA pseudouridine1911/1915/1917 synthase
MNIPIVYEDSDVVVINKPSGLLVHPDGTSQGPTLVDWILKHNPQAKNIKDTYVPAGKGGSSLPTTNYQLQTKFGIVHRLDRETSGVLVIAKNQQTFLHLKKQFQERTVKKVYNAFVYGVLKDDKGVIDRTIGKSTKDFRLWSAQRGARGALRDAVTEYRVLKRGNEVTYVEVRPKTGRTHQIRVHFKAIHHPVVCDALYAPKMPCLLGFTRLALHARSIAFTLPGGTGVAAEAPLPDEFERALASLETSG